VDSCYIRTLEIIALHLTIIFFFRYHLNNWHSGITDIMDNGIAGSERASKGSATAPERINSLLLFNIENDDIFFPIVRICLQVCSTIIHNTAVN
jgi:hypothetical protein